MQIKHAQKIIAREREVEVCAQKRNTSVSVYLNKWKNMQLIKHITQPLPILHSSTTTPKIF